MEIHHYALTTTLHVSLKACNLWQQAGRRDISSGGVKLSLGVKLRKREIGGKLFSLCVNVFFSFGLLLYPNILISTLVVAMWVHCLVIICSPVYITFWKVKGVWVQRWTSAFFMHVFQKQNETCSQEEFLRTSFLFISIGESKDIIYHIQKSIILTAVSALKVL